MVNNLSESDLDAVGIISKDLTMLETISKNLFEATREQIPTFRGGLRFLYPQNLFPVENTSA